MSWTTPPVFTVGEVLTSSTMNQLVGSGGDLPYLYGDLSWTAMSGFTNGWSSTAATASYRKVGTLVILRGGLHAGTANAAATTLPTGYRPSSGVTLVAAVPGSSTPTLVVVNASGTVVPFTSPGGGIALDGMNFSADV